MPHKLFLEIEDQDMLETLGDTSDTGSEALSKHGDESWQMTPGGASPDIVFPSYKAAADARTWLIRMYPHRKLLERVFHPPKPGEIDGKKEDSEAEGTPKAS